MECIDEKDKHPLSFDNYSPKEFAKIFTDTNYFYQNECFKEIAQAYKKQAIGDRNRNSLKDEIKKKVQLSNALEKIVNTFNYQILEDFNKVLIACKNYLPNPYKNKQ